MYSVLKEKLWAFIVGNNPELMFRLQDEYGVVKYLEEKVSAVMPFALKMLEEDKPGNAIHELCLEKMTAELKPSRYHYILDLLSSDFPDHFKQYKEEGTLTYTAVNIVEELGGILDDFRFSEKNRDSQEIREKMVLLIEDYLNRNPLHNK